MRATSRDPGRSRIEFPIIPLVNIVLLLLVAVMLTATLQVPEPFDVERGAASHGASSDPRAPQLLMDPDGRLARDGRLIGIQELLAELADAPVEVIRLEADRQARAGDVLRLRDLLFAAGVRRVELAVDVR